ncbi:bifunctional acetate--CoA ligase family protein/GNAT family N-acetyltransferase [Thermodesulfatator autotrophicus]|uniref:N-acetyltransferase domain-containing protein n=1 Tax=Thermodesulfatator autotrophicus TaxID=1795632 RepID=A0A177E507_9BACT|nr:GNAT family N-acetyltransferase [Thermodesulfatator autotrophicus]OAG26796.1 hypothetical protein TH606_10405 [Thermodesulfatator autotrophicus]
MSIYNLDYIFKPRSIAVMDVSPGDMSPSELLLRNLVWRGFKGEVFLVNKTREEVCGLFPYPSLTAIPEQIDLAILTGPVENLWDNLNDCVKKKVKGVIILARDFVARMKNPEAALSQLYAYVIKHNIRILGPNTLGFLRPHLKINASVVPHSFNPGNLAFISDSSTLASAILDWADKKKIGLSFFTSLGDKVDIDLSDMIDYLGLDFYTRALIVFIRDIKSGRKFISAARAFSRAKPIMVVKSGRFISFDGERYTDIAKIVRRDWVYAAAFRRAGIVQVDELLELFYVAESLAKQPRPKGKRLAIVTNAGGAAGIAVDTLRANNGELAELSPKTKEVLRKILPGERLVNPVDLLSDASPNIYQEAVSACLKDPQVDGVIVIHTPEFGVDIEELAWAVIRASQGVKCKPVLACFMGEARVSAGRQLLSEHNIPNFITPVETVKSFLYMHRYDHLLNLLFETPGSLLENFFPDQKKVRSIIESAAKEDRLSLGQEEVFEILNAYGIKTGKKSPSPQDDIYPLSVGMFKDPTFGSIICFAYGGRALKAEKDLALGLPPLNQTLALRILERTKIYKYLIKEKKFSPVPLEKLLVLFSHLIVDFPEIKEIELNPVWFGQEGYYVSQARIYLEDFAFLPRQETRTYHCPAHLAICPYPNQFVFQVCLKDGSVVTIRPIKPEDEPLLAEMFASLSEETLRLRFMQPRNNISHEELARICHVDYDRELNLVAEIKENGKLRIIGLINLLRLPDEVSAEMALLVADDCQGKGLGWLLCNTMLQVAKQLGIRWVYMEILCENVKMQKLAEKLGFKIQSREENVIKVVKELA